MGSNRYMSACDCDSAVGECSRASGSLLLAASWYGHNSGMQPKKIDSTTTDSERQHCLWSYALPHSPCMFVEVCNEHTTDSSTATQFPTAQAHLNEPENIVRVELVLAVPGCQNVPLHLLPAIDGDAVLGMLILADFQICQDLLCQLSQITPMQNVVLQKAKPADGGQRTGVSHRYSESALAH